MHQVLDDAIFSFESLQNCCLNQVISCEKQKNFFSYAIRSYCSEFFSTKLNEGIKNILSLTCVLNFLVNVLARKVPAFNTGPSFYCAV